MRIWDLDSHNLCRKHLLAQHTEIHALWSVITQHKKGYAKHPETLRWVGKLKALYNRHELLVVEMTKRGYKHRSPLDKRLATGISMQKEYVDTPDRQKEILRNKKCGCRV